MSQAEKFYTTAGRIVGKAWNAMIKQAVALGNGKVLDGSYDENELQNIEKEIDELSRNIINAYCFIPRSIENNLTSAKEMLKDIRMGKLLLDKQ